MNTIRIGFIPAADEGWREIAIPSSSVGAATRLLVVPGADVTARRLAVKGATPAQQRAMALSAIAPHLAAAPETCVVAMGAMADRHALVCVAARDRAQHWLAAARARGFEPTHVVPDFALLRPPEAGETYRARRPGGWVIRNDTLAFACPDHLMAIALDSNATREVDFDAELVAFIQSGGLGGAPSFSRALSSPAATAQAALPLRRIAILAAAAIILAATAPWISAARSNAAAADLRREALAVAKQALPNASRIVDPRAQLLSELAPWENDRLLVSLVTTTLEGAAAAPGASLERIEAAPSTGLSARLSVSSPDDLAPLRARFADSGLEASETFAAAGASAGRQHVDILVRTAP